MSIATTLQWKKDFPEKNAAIAKRWRENNPEKAKETYKKYKRTHKEKVNYWNKIRKASQLHATPAWADHEQIKMWYEVAEVLSRSGVKFHVDHIVPLVSDVVCGLHTHGNLRVIPWWENQSKNNKWDPNVSSY